MQDLAVFQVCVPTGTKTKDGTGMVHKLGKQQNIAFAFPV